ncbi:MAG: hypothetical protein MUF31_16695 [Akkermansiaceae bacterium]|jgi:hypothetical protein|nr:hypothetical protein [Akkermansiaceae bacterium]
MRNLVGVWFAFGADAACLIESVASFRAACPGAPVAIFDEDRLPLPEPVVARIDPALYQRTTWPRLGNLNGWPAVRGILQSCHEAARMTGATGTLKIDSDTLVLSARWIRQDAAVTGWDCGWLRYAAGMARFLRADVPDRLLRGLDRRPLLNHPVAEDLAISAEASYEFPGQVILHSRQPERPNGFRLAGWSYRLQAEGKFGLTHPAELHDVVTFGNRAQIPGARAAARSVVAAAMARFRADLQAS